MKILGLVLVLGLLASGCATVDHSVMINTDKFDGFAEGQYRDSRYGQMGGWGFWGLGGYSGDNVPSPYPWPWTSKQGGSDPVSFARSVAMINYSKKLKSIKYDQDGGIVEYEFERQSPLTERSRQPIMRRPALPPSFGHQPIE